MLDWESMLLLLFFLLGVPFFLGLLLLVAVASGVTSTAALLAGLVQYGLRSRGGLEFYDESQPVGLTPAE